MKSFLKALVYIWCILVSCSWHSWWAMSYLRFKSVPCNSIRCKRFIETWLLLIRLFANILWRNGWTCPRTSYSRCDLTTASDRFLDRFLIRNLGKCSTTEHFGWEGKHRIFSWVDWSPSVLDESSCFFLLVLFGLLNSVLPAIFCCWFHKIICFLNYS